MHLSIFSIALATLVAVSSSQPISSTTSDIPVEEQTCPQPTLDTSPDTPLEETVFAENKAAVETRSSVKKGAGIWASNKLDSAVKDLGVSWAYGWSPTPETAFTIMGLTPPDNVELVPLIYTGENTRENFASVKSKGYKEILGFNEPDAGVNSISVSDAVKAWPDFVATGLRVGSPAPAETKLREGDWFFDFMNEIKAIGSHVDFIALHHYANEFNDVNVAIASFKTYIQSVYDMYQLPIWVTEFAMVSYHPDPTQWDLPDSETERHFMTASCQMLDELKFVERYAWFAVPENAKQPATNLADMAGNLTGLGYLYKAF